MHLLWYSGFFQQTQGLMPDFYLRLDTFIDFCPIKSTATFKMAAPMESRLLCFCFFSLYFSLVLTQKDQFDEELFIKPLDSGHLVMHFQFTTKWNVDIHDQASCKCLVSDVPIGAWTTKNGVVCNVNGIGEPKCVQFVEFKLIRPLPDLSPPPPPTDVSPWFVTPPMDAPITHGCHTPPVGARGRWQP